MKWLCPLPLQQGAHIEGHIAALAVALERPSAFYFYAGYLSAAEQTSCRSASSTDSLDAAMLRQPTHALPAACCDINHDCHPDDESQCPYTSRVLLEERQERSLDERSTLLVGHCMQLLHSLSHCRAVFRIVGHAGDCQVPATHSVSQRFSARLDDRVGHPGIDGLNSVVHLTINIHIA